MRRDQPSTATNRNSLSGKDISVGETIIIPIAMRMFETMMSMTKNGRKSRKPISNARVNPVFGALISGLACYLGLGVTGGAQGVGNATTRTVVLTIVALITVDLMFTGVFYYLGL